MTAPLAELMTGDAFGRLVSGNCPRCGGADNCSCTHCPICGRLYADCPGHGSALLPVDVSTEPWSWRRVWARVVVGAVLLVWSQQVALYAFAEFRGT